MSSHRGVLHHMLIFVSDLARSMPFYSAMFRYLEYELAGESSGHQDWRRWVLGAPHEITICQSKSLNAEVPYVRGAVGHHHHMAFCALDKDDVDRFYSEVLAPLKEDGRCVVEDPPGECPEYGEGYYATFFLDPDGLKYEYVFIG